MKTFVVIPTKNDAWIIERVLQAASFFADHIIVADENSTDATQAICKKFPKVKVVAFEPKGFNESYRRQVLLNTVREWDGQNLVFGLDSDEILTSEILNSSVRDNLLSQLRPGMSAKLQWIMLWKNAHKYRYDSLPEWSENYKHFVYWDDRKINFENVRMHSSRVPEAAVEKFIVFKDVKVLHYAFAEWERMLAKHVYYLALEKTMGSKVHPYLLNRKYRWFYKTSREGLVVKDVPESWTEAYKKNNFDPLAAIPTENLYWYETEVLRFFKEFGVDFFKRLNIWQTNWPSKQSLAKERGEAGIYLETIKNPQAWYDRLYYSNFQSLLDQGGFLDKALKK